MMIYLDLDDECCLDDLEEEEGCGCCGLDDGFLEED